jgi:hypothetical protein
MADWDFRAILDEGVKPWNAWRAKHPDVVPSLRRADLRGRELIGIDLSSADVREADLTECNLASCSLVDANLTFARLDRVRLAGADLTRTNFSGASLTGSDFGNATLGGTLFTNVDLSDAAGLEVCRHKQPSAIDISSLQKSGGRLPESFLRGVGLPPQLIDYLPSLLSRPIEFYSCFLSYASPDQDFARRLYETLQTLGVSVWFAPEDLRIGDRFRTRIDESIRMHDKLVVVLSQSSVRSDWVEHEVEQALERERHEKRTVLFPIAVDSAVFETPESWARDLLRERMIGDFRHWRDESAFVMAVARLSRDLALTAAAEKTGAK